MIVSDLENVETIEPTKLEDYFQLVPQSGCVEERGFTVGEGDQLKIGQIFGSGIRNRHWIPVPPHDADLFK